MTPMLRSRLGCCLLSVFFLVDTANTAEEPQASAGTCLSPAGSFVARADATADWRIIGKNDPVPVGELMVALPGATLISGNGAVRLTSKADYDGRSPLPILETAFTVNPSGDADLDFRLDRGRVNLENTGKQGKAEVVLRFRDYQWKIGLSEPNSKVAVEMYGRWPRGVRFKLRPGPEDVPTIHVVILGLEGQFSVETREHRYFMKAPPGPAVFVWDSVSELYAPPIRLNALPEWADPEKNPSERAQQIAQRLEEFRKLRVKVGINQAIDQFFTSKDPQKVRIALVTMGAQDDLGRLAKALRESRDPELTNAGIQIVRHWLGRKEGQDFKLFKWLRSNSGLTPPQAMIVMELTHSFGDQAVQSPTTYELLIEYLRSDVRPIRNLAAWHLYRMVPDMREKIPFRPNGSKEDFAKAYRAWKKAIPEGQLPPNVKPIDEFDQREKNR